MFEFGPVIADRPDISAEHQATALPRKVLLTSTCWWPLAARLALRFASLGCSVEAMCPAQHPLYKTRAIQRTYAYSPWQPHQALTAAVSAAKPGLIVPCDDRALSHILAFQAAHPDSAVAHVSALSFCPQKSHPFLLKRGNLIKLARDLGLRAPEMRQVRGADDVRIAVADFGLPVVLKADGSWGGMGVIVAHTAAEAESARSTLLRRFSLASALRWLFMKHDPYQLLPALSGAKPQIYIQRYVPGHAANIAAASWHGEWLAGIQVEALLTRNSVGSSTVVQTIDHPDMTHAAKALFRHLGVSGFYGLDFILEDGTGHAHLIEMNARATPTTHLALGPGRDPVAALAAKLQGSRHTIAAPVTHKSVIALFPDAWLLTPHSQHLADGYHDVPWEEPDLVRELTRPPHTVRGTPAQLWRMLRG